MIYQVRDWGDHFENDRSRTRAKCSFVCVPNKQHGMGFCRIMAEADGAAIYGIWHCIIGACSQQGTPREGWLTSNGDRAGSPWGAPDLALKFRRPTAEIDRALGFLSSVNIGWIDRFGEDGTPLTADSLPTHRLVPRKKEEKEEKEEKRIASLIFPLSEKFKGNFRAVWARWLAHRSGLKEPKTGFVALFAEQLRFLEKYDEAKAVEIVEHSLRNQWQGLFPPNGKGAVKRYVPNI